MYPLTAAKGFHSDLRRWGGGSSNQISAATNDDFKSTNLWLFD